MSACQSYHEIRLARFVNATVHLEECPATQTDTDRQTDRHVTYHHEASHLLALAAGHVRMHAAPSVITRSRKQDGWYVGSRVTYLSYVATAPSADTLFADARRDRVP